MPGPWDDSVRYPLTEVRGLCLDSTATQLPEGTALASTSDTSPWEFAPSV